jgi:hypothetical protein
MLPITNKTYPIINTFKFKNLKSFETNDGIAYSCELMYDNHKIADVRNDGDGGMTFITYAQGGEDIINSINLPQYYTEDLEFDIDNEYVISDLIELAIMLKGATRNQNKAIIFTDGEVINKIKLGYTFDEFKKVGKFDMILNKVKELEDEHYFVLNTNLN